MNREWGPRVEGQHGGGDVAYPHHLRSAGMEVQDQVAEGGVQSQGSKLGDKLGVDNGVECCALVNSILVNSIITLVFFLRRWVRAVWSAIEIVSSMDLLERFANWSGSRVSRMMELMCAITSLSKHFTITDVSATGW
jgi:hypothetical protein